VKNVSVLFLTEVPLSRTAWRQRKHGFVRRLLRVVHNGIAVARVQTSSMLSNTCCTALLLQGAPASPP
jgi:hypothetical protein